MILGWALAISPTAAWIAVRGAMIPRGADPHFRYGDDVDRRFRHNVRLSGSGTDRKSGLRSIPALRIGRSLWIARMFHFQAFVALLLLYLVTELGWLAFAGVIAVGALLFYQHTLVRANDLSKMNAAFFTTNAFVSVILFATFGGAVFVARYF